jgi:hypothetical protein
MHSILIYGEELNQAIVVQMKNAEWVTSASVHKKIRFRWNGMVKYNKQNKLRDP